MKIISRKILRENRFERRIAVVRYLRNKYPDRIPIIVEAGNTRVPQIDKCKYLVICNQNLKDKVELLFKKFKINGYVWCLNLHTILDAACARLKIFDYPDISSYKNILYLDCDILIADEKPSS